MRACVFSFTCLRFLCADPNLASSSGFKFSQLEMSEWPTPCLARAPFLTIATFRDRPLHPRVELPVLALTRQARLLELCRHRLSCRRPRVFKARDDPQRQPCVPLKVRIGISARYCKQLSSLCRLDQVAHHVMMFSFSPATAVGLQRNEQRQSSQLLTPRGMGRNEGLEPLGTIVGKSIERKSMTLLDITLLDIHNFEDAAPGEENSDRCVVCGAGRGHRTNSLTKSAETTMRSHL